MCSKDSLTKTWSLAQTKACLFSCSRSRVSVLNGALWRLTIWFRVISHWANSMHRRQVCSLWEISCLSLFKIAVGMRWRDSRSITLWKASARLWQMRCQKGKSLEAWKESRRMGKIEIWRSKTRVHLVWERWNLRKSNLCRSRGRRQTVLRRCLRAHRCLFLSFKRSKLRLFRTK